MMRGDSQGTTPAARRALRTGALCVALALLLAPAVARAYIEAPYTLGRLVKEATHIVLVQVEKVDTDRNLIIYKKMADVKGKHPTDVIRHNIGRGGFHPREWQAIMAYAQPGKQALIFHNGAASETCIENYWYQCYPGGDWWNLVHGEPYLLRSYYGRPEKLVPAVRAMLEDKEVVVPCLVDGDKNALQLRSAKVQRLKASLKLLEYDAKRDFAGWGNDGFRRLTAVPGFMMQGDLGRVDPLAGGIAAADFSGDGRADLCLWGEQRVLVLQNAGSAFDEVSLPVQGGARAAAWGDYNGDSKVDLLLVTPAGPKLMGNENGSFKDHSARLPKEAYYNLTAGAWIDFDGDGKLDILLANGFLGLRLYRNLGAAEGPAFEDVSARAGLGANGAGGRVKGDHLAVADVNGDGRADFLYSAGQGVLVINTPQGFVESKDSGIQYAAGNVAPIFADLDADKAADLVVPQPEGCRLLRNDGKGHFTDVTAQSGELAEFKGHATSAVVADFNNRGKLDLLVGCFRAPNRYFRNRGDGTFEDAGDEIGIAQRVFNTRDLCVVDLNNDKVLDLAMSNEGQESTVLVGAPARVESAAAMAQ